MIESLLNPIVKLDTVVNRIVYENSAPWLVKSSLWVSDLGNGSTLFSLAILTCLIFLFRKHWSGAFVIVFSVWYTSMAVTFLKDYFSRLRPENAISLIGNGSMPSGHAALAAAFFVACIYIFLPHLRSYVSKGILAGVCLSAMIAIGLSRIFLNVHWVSDVVVGWLLGTAIVLVLVFISRRFTLLLARVRAK